MMLACFTINWNVSNQQLFLLQAKCATIIYVHNWNCKIKFELFISLDQNEQFDGWFSVLLSDYANLEFENIKWRRHKITAAIFQLLFMLMRAKNNHFRFVDFEN